MVGRVVDHDPGRRIDQRLHHHPAHLAIAGDPAGITEGLHELAFAALDSSARGVGRGEPVEHDERRGRGGRARVRAGDPDDLERGGVESPEARIHVDRSRLILLADPVAEGVRLRLLEGLVPHLGERGDLFPHQMDHVPSELRVHRS